MVLYRTAYCMKMSYQRKVGVVTGTWHIGVIRALCSQFDGDVLLTGMDPDHAVVRTLEQEGFQPRFLPLDVTDQHSVDTLRTYINDNYGGIDILIHNAASVKFPKYFPFAYRVEKTIGRNFYGTLLLIRRCWKLLRPRARLYFVMGTNVKSIFSECSLDLQSQLRRHNLTMAQLELLMDDFVIEGKKGRHFIKGWPSDEFAISQLGATIMAEVLNREAVDDYRGDIVVTACCPRRKNADTERYEINPI